MTGYMFGAKRIRAITRIEDGDGEKKGPVAASGL